MEEKIIDMEYLIKYLSNKLWISTAITSQVMYSELEYLTGLGLMADEPNSPEELEETNVIYMDELIDFIYSKTKISKTIIETILGEENQYMEQLDLI